MWGFEGELGGREGRDWNVSLSLTHSFTFLDVFSTLFVSLLSCRPPCGPSQVLSRNEYDFNDNCTPHL